MTKTLQLYSTALPMFGFEEGFLQHADPANKFATLVEKPSSNHLVVGLEDIQRTPEFLTCARDAGTEELALLAIGCHGKNYIGKLRAIVASYTLAVRKAQAFGDITQPIYLNAASYGTFDAINGRWVEQITGLMDARRTVAAKTFLEEVYNLAEQNKHDEATDLVYDHFHKVLTARDYAECREVFRLADVKRLTSSLLRSFLSLTVRDKVPISTRVAFYESALSEITRQQDPDRANRLVGHLR
jgi:hypothetical protein